MHAAFEANILAGIHVVCSDVILSKCKAAKMNAASDTPTANRETVSEFKRINVKQCSRTFCRGIRRNSIKIRPKILAINNCKIKIQLIVSIIDYDGVYTISPLQYGLSRVRVLGAHSNIQSAKDDIQNPIINWKISNSFAKNG